MSQCRYRFDFFVISTPKIGNTAYGAEELCSTDKAKERLEMKYVCDVCGWEYDEALGDESQGIKPGTKFEALPEDFECPLCGVGKDMFSKVS